jgi:hypothetical protein
VKITVDFCYETIYEYGGTRRTKNRAVDDDEANLAVIFFVRPFVSYVASYDDSTADVRRCRLCHVEINKGRRGFGFTQDGNGTRPNGNRDTLAGEAVSYATAD